MIRWDPTRLDPCKELEELSERFSRIFGRVSARSESNREALTVADWVPKVDIAEAPTWIGLPRVILRLGSG